VQQIITAYLVPFALFALVHGPLSDALGRRSVVMGGLVLYTAGSIGCFFAPTFGWLLFFRVLQGTAAGIGPTVARAMVRDLFDGPNAQRLMSSIMLVFSLAPAVAPIIGGWVHVYLGWRWVFGMLVVIGAALVLTCALLLPESHPKSKRTKFEVGALAKSCWHVGTQPAYFLLAIAAALALGTLFMYIGSAPFIILERWHLQETQFHYIFIPVVIGFMLSSWIGGRIAETVTRDRQLRIGFGLLLLSCAISAATHLFVAQLPILLVQILWCGMALGAQMTYPVLTLEMIDMFPHARGAAASVQSFVALGVGGLLMGVVAPLLQGDLHLLAWISLAMGGVAWFAWRWGMDLQRTA
jgi:MFS transporter, DHA1 family, multidrug resistance protein